MTETLLPCPDCKRHLRASETTCPFCSTTLPAGFGAAPGTPAAIRRTPVAPRRLSRAALFSLGTLAASPAACVTSVPVYGGSPSDGAGGESMGSGASGGETGTGGSVITGGATSSGGETSMGGESELGGFGGENDMGDGGGLSVPVYGTAPSGDIGIDRDD